SSSRSGRLQHRLGRWDVDYRCRAHGRSAHRCGRRTRLLPARRGCGYTCSRGLRDRPRAQGLQFRGFPTARRRHHRGDRMVQVRLTPRRASDPTTALDLLSKEDPSVAISDLNLSPWDGFDLLEDVREKNSIIAILVLTARASEDDKVRALDAGADDYVLKPFGHRELVARIRAHARRAARDRKGKLPHATLEVGALRLDLRARLLEITGEEELQLTGTEFRLLEYLMRNSNAVVPTSALARHAWGYAAAPARAA